MTIKTKQDAKDYFLFEIEKKGYITYCAGGRYWKQGLGRTETIKLIEYEDPADNEYIWNFRENNGSRNLHSIAITEKEAIQYIFENRKYINNMKN